jgi:hypothetical protein
MVELAGDRLGCRHNVTANHHHTNTSASGYISSHNPRVILCRLARTEHTHTKKRMMAVLAAILPLVSQSSTLALELYRFAAAEVDTTRHLIRTAKSITSLALVVKQVGTVIKEDDRLLSAEVCLYYDTLSAPQTNLIRPSRHSTT